MKKLTILTAIGVVSCLTSFGQGYFFFNNASSDTVRDNFTFGYSTNSPATVMVGVLWMAGSGNTFAGLGNSSTATNQTASWSTILAAQGAGWNWATNSSTSAILTTPTRAPFPTTGTFSGGALGIAGTNPGDTISMYVIGWAASFGANPNAAALGSGALGWSNPINEVLGSSGSPGVAMNNAGMTGFVVNPVPEPATFALAGIGAAAMLIFRRRK
jgi:hypothetical protein